MLNNKKKTAKKKKRRSSREGTKHNGRSNETNFHCYYAAKVVVAGCSSCCCALWRFFSVCFVYCVVCCVFIFRSLLFFFSHKTNVSQTLIVFYFLHFHSQLSEEFWAATNCDKSRATTARESSFFWNTLPYNPENCSNQILATIWPMYRMNWAPYAL